MNVSKEEKTVVISLSKEEASFLGLILRTAGKPGSVPLYDNEKLFSLQLGGKLGS